MIDSLDGVVDRDQLRGLVSEMNTKGTKILGTEWTLAILSTIAKAAEVNYEQPFGRKRPDLHVRVPGRAELEFVADITTVSDRGYDEQNPVEEFDRGIRNAAKEMGIRPQDFDIQIGGEKDGEYGDQRMQLLLPRTHEERARFDGRLRQFLGEIAAAPTHKCKLDHRESSVEVSITYRPGQRYATRGHLSYTATYGKERNPVYSALRKKKGQLQGIGSGICRGVIVCDGNCELVRSEGASAGAFSLGDVVGHFFGQTDVIEFAVFVGVTEPMRSWMGSASRGPQLWVRKCVHPRKETGPGPAIAEWLGRTLLALPQPEVTPLNALNRLRGRNPHQGASHRGGWQLSDPYVRISARRLQELLAGKVRQKVFLEEHGFIASKERRGQAINPFKLMLGEGRPIRSVAVEHGGAEDDDWLTFEFGSPAPGLVPFRLPKKK